MPPVFFLPRAAPEGLRRNSRPARPPKPLLSKSWIVLPMTFLLRSQPSDQPSDLVASFCPWFWLVAGRMVGELEPRLVNLRTGGLPGLTGLGRIPTDFFLKQSLKNVALSVPSNSLFLLFSLSETMQACVHQPLHSH